MKRNGSFYTPRPEPVHPGPEPPQHRLVLLVGEMVAGGLEQQLCYLLEGMDRDRYRPLLVVWNFRESDVNVPKVRALGVPIHGYPVSMSSGRKLFEFTRLVRLLGPEVVHSYGFYTNFAAFIAARAAGAIGVGSLRGERGWLELIESRPVLGRLSTALPSNQISNSYAAARRMMENSKWLRPRELLVVPNGLDVTSFKDTPIPLGRPHSILGVGALLPVKRWDRLLRVADGLKRGGIPSIVQIAGDGPQRGELEALASSLGVGDITRFLGHREDIRDLMSRARVIVHTSDAEGSPNAVMEAMASARPVVATDVGDVSHLVEDGKTGFVVRPDDAAGLLGRVMDLVSDDTLARRLGEAARCRATEDFSLPRLVDQTFEAYCRAGWKA